MFKVLTATAVALVKSVQAASVTAYSILNGTTNGFGYSVFHNLCSHQMNSSALEDSDAFSPGGTWDTSIGAISFIFTLAGDGPVTAVGDLDLFSAYDGSGQYIEVGGYIDMTFTGADGITDGTHAFTFATGNQLANRPHFPANGVFTDFSQLNLWETTARGITAAPVTPKCIGVDLGLSLAPVPLPEAGLLLISRRGGAAETQSGLTPLPCPSCRRHWARTSCTTSSPTASRRCPVSCCIRARSPGSCLRLRHCRV